ncbi:hypothetical protein BFP76_11800 [Amylibacter kogurei]|uniref:DUF454 domain-containing protein n=1 Tax=Paramylibacter kogurei TaxID=1889778 RepID=A0A2G5KD75_9RHOB|nr:YbaN family protein [Amylibacter kogurei]PIB26574.1 hypothetical protein BFP76_11800 [Amylibacter kogurei]
MKNLWTMAGFVMVALGAIGAILPLLPTTVFMIMAAFCFAKGSDRAHAWLMNHKIFGQAIKDWQRNGAIAPKSKRIATLSIIAVFLVSVLMNVNLPILILQAGILTCVLIFIWTRPNH